MDSKVPNRDTEDNDIPFKHIVGKHWRNKKGFKLIAQKSNYNHFFGGDTWKLPICKNCGKNYHQIITLDMKDSRLDLGCEGDELALASCLNCSTMWSKQLFKIDFNNKKIEVLSDNDLFGWIQEDDLKIPSPLPVIPLELVELSEDENPITEELYYRNFEKLGKEYLARISGAPLYAQAPIDLECPSCHGKMQYLASVSAKYKNNIFRDFDFDIGDSFLYFAICPKCNVMQVECQGD